MLQIFIQYKGDTNIKIFCRYYVAEGVRNASQETWKMVAGNNGRKLVQTYIKNVVGFLLTDKIMFLTYNHFIIFY